MTMAKQMAYAMFPWAWDSDGSPGERKRDQQQAMSKAVLALEGMCEPTPGMIAAAGGNKMPGFQLVTLGMWQAMIDAAILEAKGEEIQ